MLSFAFIILLSFLSFKKFIHYPVGACIIMFMSTPMNYVLQVVACILGIWFTYYSNKP